MVIHKTAIVSDGAEIDATAKIGPYCIIGERLDLRCIVPDAVKIVAKRHYKHIIIEAKKSIMVAKTQTIRLANDNGIFIYGV